MMSKAAAPAGTVGVEPANPGATRERAMFLALCLVWGTTWLAMKVGIATVPPAFFAGTRWTIAGIALLVYRRLAGHSLAIPFRLRARLVLCSVLMVSLNQVIQLYGLYYVPAGLAAVLSSALTPISLLGFSVAVGQERFHWRQAAAIALGVVGILVLFGPQAVGGALHWQQVLAAGGIAVGCLCYSAGSVLAKPVMRSVPPAHFAAMTNLIGGALLLVSSLIFEPGVIASLTAGWGWPAFGAWLYMLLPGSLGATIIYFLLVRDWGASRAGTYSFVSPVIAVAIGGWLFGETVRAADILGTALMLAAAGMVLQTRR